MWTTLIYILVVLIVKCLAQEVNVGEEPATRWIYRGSRVTMRCSGDNVVGGSHVWTISNTIVNRAGVSLGGQLPNIPGFTFSLISTTNMLISTVQFTIEMPHIVTCLAAGVGTLQTNLLLHDLAEEINIGEEPFTREVCHGSSVIMRCSGSNIVGATHLWTVSNTSVNNAAASLGQLPNFPGFIFSVTNTTNMLISTIQFTIEMSHTVTCTASGVGSRQTTLSLYGLPTPMVNIYQRNISSLDLNISQPGQSALCVQMYNITMMTVGSSFKKSLVILSMNSSSTHVIVDDLQLCRYNYTVNVVAIDLSGRSSDPFFEIIIGGYLDLPNFIYEMGVVSWSVPTDLMDCIAGYEYSFQYSGVSGVLPANTNMLSIDMFNISTCCNADTLTITPIYHQQQQISVRNSNKLECIDTGVGLEAMITKEKMITPRIECGSQGQHYFGALIGVIIAALVINIALTLVIIFLAVKVKSLKSKIVLTSTENEESQYDEVTDSKSNKQKLKKNTYNLTKKDAGIAMVGCEAYGKVFVQPQVQSAGQHGEGAAGVYEVV